MITGVEYLRNPKKWSPEEVAELRESVERILEGVERKDGMFSHPGLLKLRIYYVNLYNLVLSTMDEANAEGVCCVGV